MKLQCANPNCTSRKDPILARPEFRIEVLVSEDYNPIYPISENLPIQFRCDWCCSIAEFTVHKQKRK